MSDATSQVISTAEDKEQRELDQIWTAQPIALACTLAAPHRSAVAESRGVWYTIAMKPDDLLRELPTHTERAVAHYWATRVAQRARQHQTGRTDQGLRSEVTGGAQMDGFIHLLTDLIVACGIPESSVFSKRAVELPGFFRPTKEWDLLVVHEKTLLTVIEAKCQVGPSFGNNFNNRTEEALGTALDIWTAFRERVFLSSPQPFLGYLFMLEDCDASKRPVRVQEPHFKVLPEFVDASYVQRYEIFCRRLVLERQYTAAAFLLSAEDSGIAGEFSTPSEDLSIERFARSLAAHLAAFA